MHHTLLGLYWTCEGTAQTDYTSSQLITIVCVGVYLLVPTSQRGTFGNLKYWESQRKWCALEIGKLKYNEWPSECKIHYNGPATWTEDGS